VPIKLNQNINLRHHSAHPQSSVRPNLDINQKPNYVPPEEQASINVNPSLPGPVGVDAVNSRKDTYMDILDDDDPDEDTDESDEDRKGAACRVPIHN